MVLRTYSEDDAEPADGTFETGSVRVVSVPADDRELHGTEVILLQVRPRARDILRSRIAGNVSSSRNNGRRPSATQAYPPAWHAGFLAREPGDDGQYLFRVEPKLPRSCEDDPRVRFGNSMTLSPTKSETRQRGRTSRRRSIPISRRRGHSASRPLDYLEKHPFDLGADDGMLFFKLSNTGRGRADPIEPKPGQTLRKVLRLTSGAPDPAGGFAVFVDQMELRRPVSYRFWPVKKKQWHVRCCSSVPTGLIFPRSGRTCAAGRA